MQTPSIPTLILTCLGLYWVGFLVFVALVAKNSVEEVDEFAWRDSKDGLPDPERWIVKRWKNGSVWTGFYRGTSKDSSFDEWMYLPPFEEGAL
jgi:hypothetical protein